MLWFFKKLPGSHVILSLVAVQQVLPIIRGNETRLGNNYVTLAGKKKRSADVSKSVKTTVEKRSSGVK